MRKFHELNKMQSIILLYNSYVDDGADEDTAFEAVIDDKFPINTLKHVFGYNNDAIIIDSQLVVD